jgi:hypothetical protein
LDDFGCEGGKRGEAISEVEAGEAEDDNFGSEAADIVVSNFFISAFQHEILILRIPPLVLLFLNLLVVHYVMLCARYYK